MHRHPVFVLSLALLGGISSVALAGPGSFAVPPDSFINQHVDSVPQLTQQVTMDPVVRRRLARHFHTSGPAVVRYIQDNLVLKRITTARRYQVYCLARDGHEYLINSRLAVGTPVFVLRKTGQPILKLACGNPMVAVLPEQEVSPSIQSQPKLAGQPSTATGTFTPPLAPNGPVVMTVANTPDVPVVTAVSDVFGSTGLLSHVGGGGSGLGYLLGVPILYGVLHHGGGNGNSGSPGTTGTANNSGGTTGAGTGPGTTGPGTTGNNTTGNSNNTGGGTTSGSTGNNTSGNSNNTGVGTNSGGTGNNNLGTTGTNSGNNNLGTTGTGTSTGVTPVPEPGAPAAFLVGGAGLALLLAGSKRRRRVKH